MRGMALVETMWVGTAYQKSGEMIYFWPVRDTLHHWDYNVAPSVRDAFLGFQQVEVTRTTFVLNADGTQTVDLYVTMDRAGLIYWSALRALSSEQPGVWV
jgi:hypothetical protein